MFLAALRKATMVVWDMPSPQLDTPRILFVQLPSLYFESLFYFSHSNLGPCLPHTFSSVSNSACGGSDYTNMYMSTKIPSFRAFTYQCLVEGTQYQLWTTKSSVVVFSVSVGLLLLWVGYVPSNPSTVSYLICHLDLNYLLLLKVMGITGHKLFGPLFWLSWVTKLSKTIKF